MKDFKTVIPILLITPLIKTKSIEILLAIGLIFSWSEIMVAAEKSVDRSPSNSACKILLSTGGGSPYAENTSGDVLSTFNAAVLGQLVVTDETFNLHPGLLESFQFDFKSSKYILKLGPHLAFHNGRMATSADLEFSLLRGFFSQNRSFYNIYLNNIAGTEAIKPGQKFKSGSVSGVEIVDDLTVSVLLKVPNPSFLHSLSQPFFSLVPIEEMKGDYLNWKSVPIGAGPYRVVGGFKEGLVRLELVDNTLKVAGAPSAVDILTGLDSVDAPYDIVANVPANVIGPNYKEFVTSMPASVRTIFFSNKNVLGQNPHFRAAVQKAINRGEIVGQISDLAVTNELLPRHFWGRTKRLDPYSLEDAKKEISHVPADLLKKIWRVPIFSSGSLTERQAYMAGKIQHQLAKVGIKMEFYASPEKFISEKMAIESPFRLSGRVTDYVDPLIMFASFESQSPYKFDQPSGVEKVEFERLYDKAAKAKSLESRYETVRKLSEFVVSHSLAVAISEEKVIYYYNPQTVLSLGSQPTPLILLIQNIRMKR